MYGYEPVIEITPEQLLQKVTQEQIFEFVLREPFNYEFRYISPFRPDKKPDCRFEYREDGTILFVDFGERFLTGKTHRTCFRAVMDKFNCDLTASIKIICEHFNLSTLASDYEQVVETTVYTKKDYSGARSDITYIAKPYNKADILFWATWLIRPEHLLEDNVFNVKRYTVNSPNKGASLFTPYQFCYVIDFLDAVKIYQPKQIDYKWITNCNENHIGNIDNLPPTGNELIIQKSYKDHRLLRIILSEANIIWFPSEGVVPSVDILVNLIERFKLITIYYDNDEDGIIAATKLLDILNTLKPGCARMVHHPFDIKQKDPSDFFAKEGRSDLIELLKYIDIWKH